MTKLAIARKILRRDGMMWMAKMRLPQDYEKLSKEEQEWEMNCAIVEAYEAYKVARTKGSWNPDDGDFSDDEEDDKVHEVQVKVDLAKMELKKTMLNALYGK